MTVLQTLAQIPLMLYVSIVLLPVALFGYLTFSAAKKSAPSAAAGPAGPPKKESIDFGRQIASSLFLAAAIAFGFAVVILIGGIVSDYKQNKGLFAVPLPAATLPPSPGFVFPPKPEVPAPEASQ